jgi:hypothetical protein
MIDHAKSALCAAHRGDMLAPMGITRQPAVIAGLLGVLLLAGCAGAASDTEPTQIPSPTPTESANQAACDAFSKVTATMSDALNTDGNLNDAWTEVRDRMDAAALQASGYVKERLDTLVDKWPSGSALWVYQDFDEFNQMLNDVGRACEADDADVEVYTFVTE